MHRTPSPYQPFSFLFFSPLAVSHFCQWRGKRKVTRPRSGGKAAAVSGFVLSAPEHPCAWWEIGVGQPSSSMSVSSAPGTAQRQAHRHLERCVECAKSKGCWTSDRQESTSSAGPFRLMFPMKAGVCALTRETILLLE